MDAFLTSELAGSSLLRELPVVVPLLIPRALVGMRTLRLSDRLILALLVEQWQLRGRPEWFFVSNLALVLAGGINERSVMAARARLARHGWIDVKAGHACKKKIGRFATRFHLTQKTLDLFQAQEPFSLNTSTST